jgi:hypothetical protein
VTVFAVNLQLYSQLSLPQRGDVKWNSQQLSLRNYYSLLPQLRKEYQSSEKCLRVAEYRSQKCYFVTHLILILSQWGAVSLSHWAHLFELEVNFMEVQRSISLHCTAPLHCIALITLHYTSLVCRANSGCNVIA